MEAALKEALKVLGLNDVTDHPPKMKVVTRRFYELSLIHHPDRPGGDNPLYQVISQAYRFIGEYIEKHYGTNNDDPDEDIARHVFRSFNFDAIKENLSSFTINIDNGTSLIWDTVLTKHYGKPIDRTRNNNGKHWKHPDYLDDNSNKGHITIGKWHQPKKDNQSKLNIQSSETGNFLPAHFVSVHLPKLLSEVQAATPNPSLDCLPSSQPKNCCTTCNYKAPTKSQLTLHIKRAHKNSFAAKPSITFDVPPPYNVLPSTPTLGEPVMFQCFLCSSSYNQGEWSAHEKAAHCFQCTTCDESFPAEDGLSHHIMSSHEAISAPPPPDETPTSDSSIPDITSKNNIVENASSGPPVRKNSEESKTDFKCEHCDFTANLNRAIRTHMMRTHSVPPNNPYSCGVCAFTTDENASLMQHTLAVHMKNTPGISVHKLQSFHCDKCIFTALKESTLRDHIKTKHESPAESISLECELCPYTAPLKINLKRHIAVTHAKIQCDQCHFTSSSQFHLALHKDQDHSQPQPPKEQLYPCTLCGMTFSQLYDLDSHIKRRHCPPQDEPSTQTPNHTLTMVLEEQIDMAQSFKEMKASMDAQLSEIRRHQETFRDDIKQLLQDNTALHSSFNRFEKLQSNIDCQVQNISTFISTLSRTPAPTPAATAAPPPTVSLPTRQSPVSSSLEAPETATGYSQTPADPPTYQNQRFVPPRQRAPPSPDQSSSTSKPLSKPQPSAHQRSRLATSQRPKVLFIADSIGSNVDVRHLEEATNSLIYTEEAYGAEYKPDAFRPHENFNYASNTAPSKRNFKYAILQGSSTDITDLDTSKVNHAQMEFLKQEVFVASQNMVSAARNIILNNPGVEKVLILDRTPRFDLPSADPTNLKSKLSEYGNKVFRDVLENCDVKAKISVASHTLPNQLQQNLYGHPDRRGYDGIHLNGPDGRNHYTRSVCNILQRFLSKTAREPHHHTIPRNQPEVNTKKNTPVAPLYPTQQAASVVIDIDPPTTSDDHQYAYSVPTYNPFNVLGN